MESTPGTTVSAAKAAKAVEAAWSEVLDALEADVDRAIDAAEGLEVAPRVGWQIPTMDTPMPASLESRARQLLARQGQLTQGFPALITQTGQQLRATDHFASSNRRGAVYLDVSV